MTTDEFVAAMERITEYFKARKAEEYKLELKHMWRRSDNRGES